MSDIHYITHDERLNASDFIDLAIRTWSGFFDEEKTRHALSRTVNITAWEDERLVGCVRILSDGYLFGTIPEITVDPEYQGRGIGKHLMELAWEASPTSLFFGAQPGNEKFYEGLGYVKSMQSYSRKKTRN